MAEEIGGSAASGLLTEPSRPTYLQLGNYCAITLKHFKRIEESDSEGEMEDEADEDHRGSDIEEDDGGEDDGDGERRASASTLTSCWFRGVLNLKTNVLVTIGSMDIFLAGSQRLGGASDSRGETSVSDTKLLQSLDAAEFLAFMCMSVVESNFGVIEEIGDRMDDAELDILEELPRMHIYAEGDLTMSVARDVHVLKRELFLIRRSFWPCREALSSMLQSHEDRLREPGPQQYTKQAYDYSITLIDNAETLRELGTNLVDLYSTQLSLVCCSSQFDPHCSGGRSNPIQPRQSRRSTSSTTAHTLQVMEKQMKVLAMFEFVFLPLMFMAGVGSAHVATTIPSQPGLLFHPAGVACV